MAKIKGNNLMVNVRGMIGKQVVFKQRLGTPYVAAAPYTNDKRVAKGEEKANRNRFAEAVELAKQALDDPELKKEYAALARKGQTAYNVAVSDARVPPEIKTLVTQGYNGRIGSCVLIQATDNVKVKRVRVIIYDAAHALIEEGDASDNGDNYTWLYTATVEVENIAGCTIEVSAHDIAGNITRKAMGI